MDPRNCLQQLGEHALHRERRQRRRRAYQGPQRACTFRAPAVPYGPLLLSFNLSPGHLDFGLAASPKMVAYGSFLFLLLFTSRLKDMGGVLDS